MRMRLLLVVAAGLLVAADTKDDAAKKELQKFKGTWVMVSGEVDGKPVPDEHVKKSKITWDGDKVTLFTPHQSDKPIEAKTTVDPSKSPKEMDWTRSVGPNAQVTMHAIYEFDGEDKYKICFDPSGKERPREFATKTGTGHMLHVWKRQKE
jgi:uncharacterized protein (TIGR03067 family)